MLQDGLIVELSRLLCTPVVVTYVQQSIAHVSYVGIGINSVYILSFYSFYLGTYLTSFLLRSSPPKRSLRSRRRRTCITLPLTLAMTVTLTRMMGPANALETMK